MARVIRNNDEYVVSIMLEIEIQYEHNEGLK